MSTNVFWRKTSDGLSLVVGAIGFASSMYILASPTSGSVCRPPTPNGIEVLLTMFPAIVMTGALLLSDAMRSSMGGAPSRLLSLLQHVLAALVAGWLGLCLGSLPWVSVLVVLPLLVGAGTVWFFGRSEEDA